jgi:hypothetical protein
MLNLVSKLLKGKDKATENLLSESDLNEPRYADIKTLASKIVPCELWGDDALIQFGIPMETAHPNLLCLIVPDTRYATIHLATAGWKLVEKLTLEMEKLGSDPSLSADFFIHKLPNTKTEIEFEHVENENEEDQSPELEATSYDNPLLYLISGEKFGYEFSSKPFTHILTLTSYVSGFLYRYIMLPHSSMQSRAATLKSLQKLYVGDHLPEPKQKSFEKKLPKEYRQLHSDLIKNPDWKQFMTNEVKTKYETIFEKARNLR